MIAASTATTRWAANLPLLVAGGVSIVAGGLVAAVTGPADWEHGAWVAAFLVLVAGVAQVGIAVGQAGLAPNAPAISFVAVEGLSWNVACITIITGTLRSNPVAVTIGSALLIIALGVAAFAVSGSDGQHRLLLWSYRVLLVVLLMSIPVGIALSWVRH